MQTTGDRVSAAAELTAGVEHRQDDLDGGLSLGAVHVDRDSAAVVDHPNRTVLEDRDRYGVAIAGQGLVDRVVDDLVHQVMKAPLTGRADVHAGSLAHRLQSFEDLDGVSPVFVLDLAGVCELGIFGNAFRDF